MKRAFEFTPSDPEAMVSRILVVVHKAIDESFPEAKPAPHRFAKTVFGDEPTVNQLMPHEAFNNQHPMTEDDLREASDRSGSKSHQLVTDETGGDHGTPEYDEMTVINTIFGSRERRYRQTLVGCLIVVIGIILAYLFW